MPRSGIASASSESIPSHSWKSSSWTSSPTLSRLCRGGDKTRQGGGRDTDRRDEWQLNNTHPPTHPPTHTPTLDRMRHSPLVGVQAPGSVQNWVQDWSVGTFGSRTLCSVVGPIYLPLPVGGRQEGPHSLAMQVQQRSRALLSASPLAKTWGHPPCQGSFRRDPRHVARGAGEVWAKRNRRF